MPTSGKFSFSNKLFHTSLALLGFLMVVTGICLSLDTLGWADMGQNWMRQQRLLHDIGTWGFITLLVAHIFWQLLRGNFATMLHGRISRERLAREFDWGRWKPGRIVDESGHEHATETTPKQT